mgnify:CR=1 FL=1
MSAELIYEQKPIMSVEWTISLWVVIDWTDEMSPEELLVARIRQLERRPEDVEHAKARLYVAREKNKDTPAETEEDRGGRLGVDI